MTAYIHDNAWHAERARLQSLEHVYDPGSIHHLEQLGVGPGWRCLEVGPGGGSITQWLCTRVGPIGHVVAADIDPRFVATLALPNLEVRRHDIVTDELESEAFDLVFARFVLEHLPGRDQALTRMVGALRPGGWLLVEDMDWISVAVAPDPPAAGGAIGAELFLRAFRAGLDTAQAAGMDLECGRTLWGRLAAHGLGDVGAEGRVAILRGGTPSLAWVRLSMAARREALVSSGVLTAAELDRVLALQEHPAFVVMGPVCMAAWGRLTTPGPP